jgi:hypothetical protein
MRDELLQTYPSIKPEQVFITGTPQFDFHFKPEFWLSRGELCDRVGLNPDRPFVLYTTGRDHDFPEEHRHVETVIDFLREVDVSAKPQLLVRTYAKGTSPDMRALAEQDIADVVFPPILWNERWLMPEYEDLAIYTSELRHAALGINAASTVSLELLMHDKPALNLGFDPPGSDLPHCLRWERHIDFDHYRPVAESGATMVARSKEDVRQMLTRGLTEPQADSAARQRFMHEVFDGPLDGQSGRRVAECLLRLSPQGGPDAQ